MYRSCSVKEYTCRWICHWCRFQIVSEYHYGEETFWGTFRASICNHINFSIEIALEKHNFEHKSFETMISYNIQNVSFKNRNFLPRRPKCFMVICTIWVHTPFFNIYEMSNLSVIDGTHFFLTTTYALKYNQSSLFIIFDLIHVLVDNKFPRIT